MEGLAEGKKIGIEKGRKDGEFRNQIKTALVLIKKGLDDKFVNEATNLNTQTLSRLLHLTDTNTQITLDEIIEKITD